MCRPKHRRCRNCKNSLGLVSYGGYCTKECKRKDTARTTALHTAFRRWLAQFFNLRIG